jgi:anthranilate phosphoribosyltransferase
LKDGRVTTWRLDPKEFGIPDARLSDLQVESVEQAADCLQRVLAGERGPMRDIALLNAAAALVVAGRVQTIGAALQTVATAVDSGAVKRTLEMLIRTTI